MIKPIPNGEKMTKEDNNVRHERSFLGNSRGAELRRAIHRMWANNRRLPPGSNNIIELRIQEIMEEFDLTLDEWHHWAREVSLKE